MPNSNCTVPLPGDGVWHPEYKNGIVQDINWEDKEAFCKFYNDDITVEIELEHFRGNWREQLQQWLLY